jgi:hypothetical protein
VIFLLKEEVLDIDLGIGLPLKSMTSTQFSSSQRSVQFFHRSSSIDQKDSLRKSSTLLHTYCSFSQVFLPIKGVSVTLSLDNILKTSLSSKATHSQNGLYISENILAFILVFAIQTETGIHIHLLISFFRKIANSK